MSATMRTLRTSPSAQAATGLMPRVANVLMMAELATNWRRLMWDSLMRFSLILVSAKPRTGSLQPAANLEQFRAACLPRLWPQGTPAVARRRATGGIATQRLCQDAGAAASWGHVAPAIPCRLRQRRRRRKALPRWDAPDGIA